MEYVVVSLLVLLLYLNQTNCVRDYAPTGCSFNSSGIATCDFNTWRPPLDEDRFGPENIYQIIVQNVDGTVPSYAFSGIHRKNPRTTKPRIKFECNLENLILSDNVFTKNLDWIERLEFEGCYIQDGIAGNSLSNLTSLEEFKVTSGIIGTLTPDSFAGLSSLQTLILRADFLDTALPVGLFTNHPNLQQIDLRSSGVIDIPADAFTGLDQLTTLDLRENGLTTLPEGLFQSLTSLNTIQLGMNAWDCTCDLAWLATWSLYTGVYINVDCSTPSQFAGNTLNRAVATLGCLESQTTTPQADDSSSTSDDSRIWMTYLALGVAGFAFIVALVTSSVLCIRYCDSTSTSKRSDGRRNRVQPNGQKPTDSRSRPPSYRTSERMVVHTPIQTKRSLRAHPLFNVRYQH